MFDVPDEVAAQWAPVAAAKGAVVVDNSGAFRMDPDVPLVVPEVNAHAARMRPRGIIANPNCTTLSMIVALGALHAEFGLRELVVSSYQAVSGAGRAGVDDPAAAAVHGRRYGAGHAAPVTYGGPSATTPGRSRRRSRSTSCRGPARSQEDGWSSEELKVRDESRKILGLPELPVAATCVRVPVITTHSLDRARPLRERGHGRRAHEILATAPGVVLFDDPAAGEFPTPADVVGTDPTWVGRVRRALDDPTGAGALRVRRQPAQGRGAEHRADRGARWRPSSVLTARPAADPSVRRCCSTVRVAGRARNAFVGSVCDM